MRNFPKVSIVTPSYNQAKFLEETILSVINQDYPDIEYIVIDGGSTDGSQEIIKKYESKIAYWVSEKDSGQSDAINKGFKKCTGDIVAWINSDDLYNEGAVTRVVKYFTEHPDVDMVHGNIDLVDERSEFITSIRATDFTLQQLIITNQIWQPSVFFNRKIFGGIGYLDESYHYIMDYDFWIRIATRYNVRFIDSTIARFRLHGQSKTVSNSDLFLIENLIMLDRLLQHGDLQGVVKKSAYTSMQALLTKFFFNHPAEIQKYMQNHDHLIIGKIYELAKYRSSLLNRDIGYRDLNKVKIALRNYYFNYLKDYKNYQDYVDDKSIDSMVDSELYNISNYLYETGQHTKSLKLLLLLIVTDLCKFRFDNIKLLALKKYTEVKIAVKNRVLGKPGHA